MEDILPELIAIRRKLHTIPELGLSEVKTPDLIAQTLEAWGIEVHRGIAGTGIVGQLRRGRGNRSIGLRADFDALPMTEETGLPYQSTHPGVMHACGHDGHTAMLLGAAWLLSQRNDLDGCVNFIFQPAEENFGGGKLMVEDGLLERFPCDRLFALHNLPGLSAGVFATRAGAITAAVDVVRVTITGRGGHGAMPETTIDPIMIGAGIITALQSIVARNVDPSDAAVVTVGAFHAGTVSTIIPDTAELQISLRSLRPETRAALCARVEAIVTSHATGHGARVGFDWDLGYPATINDAENVRFAKDVIVNRFGEDNFIALEHSRMFSEDFSFMLEKAPGAYVLIGNGDSAPLHSTTYDFNDAIIGPGARFFADLAQSHLSPAATGAAQTGL